MSDGLILALLGPPVWIIAGLLGNWARRRWLLLHRPYEERLAKVREEQ